MDLLQCPWLSYKELNSKRHWKHHETTVGYNSNYHTILSHIFVCHPRTGGPGLKSTQVYPVGFAKRILTLHKNLMDRTACKCISYHNTKVHWSHWYLSIWQISELCVSYHCFIFLWLPRETIGISPPVLLLDTQDFNGLELQAAVKSAWFKLRDGKTLPVWALVDERDTQKIMFCWLHEAKHPGAWKKARLGQLQKALLSKWCWKTQHQVK